jgi:hypothetical protein
MRLFLKYNLGIYAQAIVLVLFLVFAHTSIAQIDPVLFSPRTSPEVYGVLPADKKLFVYKVHQTKGELDFNVKNEELENIAYHSLQLPSFIEKLEVDIHDDQAFILLGYGESKNYLKKLLIVDLETGAYRTRDVLSNFDFPSFFKAFSSAILMIGVLEEGDVMEIYNFDQNHLSTITDFFRPNTRIWDIKVVNDQVDLLLMLGEKKRKHLQVVSFDQEGNRLLNIPVKFPDNKNFYIRNAQILHGPFNEQKIVGIYSNKYGEWFSGYFHLEINEFLEQRFQLYPYKELDGFYDYLGNNKKYEYPPTYKWANFIL